MTKQELRNAYQATPEYKALVRASKAADYAGEGAQMNHAAWLAAMAERDRHVKLVNDTPEMKAWNKMLSELRATDDD